MNYDKYRYAIFFLFSDIHFEINIIHLKIILYFTQNKSFTTPKKNNLLKELRVISPNIRSGISFFVTSINFLFLEMHLIKFLYQMRQ